MKLRRPKYLLLSLGLLVPLLCCGATPSAQSVVRQAVSAIEKAPGLQVQFKATSQNETLTGTLTLCGKKMALKTDALQVWYDGKTQWAYQPSVGEVNVSEPDAGELAQTNPIALLDRLKTGCNLRRLPSAKGIDKIEFTPKVGTAAAGDYRSVAITFSVTTHLPSHIQVVDTNGTKTEINIKDIRNIPTPPMSCFRFDKRKYPNAEIIDLR